MQKKQFILLFIFLTILIGCARTHHVTDIGVRYFQLPEADPNNYSIVLGRFPEKQYGPSNLGMWSNWIIQKDLSEIKVSLVGGGKRILSSSYKNFVYALNDYYYAILFPSGHYWFEYYFPIGSDYNLKHEMLYTREITVNPGEIIYMGSHHPVIETNYQYIGNQTRTISQFQKMEIISNYEEDISNFKEKYPSVFSEHKFVVKDISR